MGEGYVAAAMQAYGHRPSLTTKLLRNAGCKSGPGTNKQWGEQGSGEREGKAKDSHGIAWSQLE